MATKAAQRFGENLKKIWESFDCWENTARAGYLSEADDEILRGYCDEFGEDRAIAEAEVVSVVRACVGAAKHEKGRRSGKQAITIFRDHIWAGDGRLVDGQVEDCAAVLGPDQDASDETYEAIQDAIEAGEDSVTRPDGTYTWDLS